VVDHFEKCEDCRDQFDAEEYTSETLIEFSSKMRLSNTKLEDWTCQKTQPYSCDHCNKMTNQLLIDTEFQVFQCMDCGENNNFSEGS
jgi:ribosomal protein L37AE/L43A